MQVRQIGHGVVLPEDAPKELRWGTMVVHGGLGTNGVVGQCVHAANLLAWLVVRRGDAATSNFGLYVNDDGPLHPGRFGHAFVRSGDWLLDPTRAQFNPEAPFIERWTDAADRYIPIEDVPASMWEGLPGNPLSVLDALESVDGEGFARDETLDVLRFVGLDELVGPLRRRLRGEPDTRQCAICDHETKSRLVARNESGDEFIVRTCEEHRALVALSFRCQPKSEAIPDVADLVKAARLLPPLRGPNWIGRNDQCPCGSGLKFKRCCG